MSSVFWRFPEENKTRRRTGQKARSGAVSRGCLEVVHRICSPRSKAHCLRGLSYSHFFFLKRIRQQTITATLSTNTAR